MSKKSKKSKSQKKEKNEKVKKVKKLKGQKNQKKKSKKLTANCYRFLKNCASMECLAFLFFQFLVGRFSSARIVTRWEDIYFFFD